MDPSRTIAVARHSSEPIVGANGAGLFIDAYLPRMNGHELLQRLDEAGDRLPSIVITGNSDVSIAVQVVKAGASDFSEKPTGSGELLASIERAVEQSQRSNKLIAWRETAAIHIADLTSRQRQVTAWVFAGHWSCRGFPAYVNAPSRTIAPR